MIIEPGKAIIGFLLAMALVISLSGVVPGDQPLARNAHKQAATDSPRVNYLLALTGNEQPTPTPALPPAQRYPQQTPPIMPGYPLPTPSPLPSPAPFTPEPGSIYTPRDYSDVFKPGMTSTPLPSPPPMSPASQSQYVPRDYGDLWKTGVTSSPLPSPPSSPYVQQGPRSLPKPGAISTPPVTPVPVISKLGQQYQVPDRSQPSKPYLENQPYWGKQYKQPIVTVKPPIQQIPRVPPQGNLKRPVVR